MKRHLSLILMALVAGAMMFTSCGKEEYTITANANDATMGTVTGGGKYAVNTEVTLTATANAGYEFVKWNDGNTSNPRTIVVTEDATYTAEFQRQIPDGVTISFEGNSWQAANVLAFDHTVVTDENPYPYITFEVFKTYNSENDVHLQGFLQNVVGHYDYETSHGDFFKYIDPNSTWTDEDGLVGAAGNTYYRWQSYEQVLGTSTFEETVTAVDLNNKTISATWSEDIFDVEDYALSGGEPSPHLLSGLFKNATWTWGQTSKATSKKNNDSKFLVVK